MYMQLEEKDRCRCTTVPRVGIFLAKRSPFDYKNYLNMIFDPQFVNVVLLTSGYSSVIA